MLTNNDTEEINKGLKLLVKTSFVVFIGILLSKIFTYVYRIIIARHFGPEIYGLFSLAIMTIGWLVAFSSLGLTHGLLRFIPLYRGKKQINRIKHILKISTTILFFSSIIAGLILFFSADFISIKIFHNSDLIIFLKIFSFLIPFIIFSSILLATLRAFEEISWYSFIFNILQNCVKVVFIILLIFLGFKVHAIIFSYFLGFLSMFLVAYFVCKHKLPEIFGKYKLNKKIKSKINKEFVSYSWPIMFSTILGTMLFWVDSFLIGYFMGATDVGFYNAAVPIVLLIGFAPELFMQLFFPLINRKFSHKNLRVIKELSQQVGKWIFILNFPLFLMMILFPGAIINIFFGETYLVAENSLRILAIGNFILYLLYISYNLISMIGKSKLLLINTSIALIINIILNLILIPKYGINGAAFSTTIVLILLSMALLFEAKHYTSIIPIRKRIIKIFLVSLIPLSILIFLKQFVVINLISLLLFGLFFILSYLLLIFATGCLDKNDFMILRSLKKKIKFMNNNL